MQKFLLNSGMFALALIAVGCGKKEEPKPEPPVVSPGEQIWTKNCKVCHGQGINGAPVIGNKTMWEPRLAQGMETLYEHALNGYGLMPAKGGKTELPDEDVKLAVKYMASQAQ